MTEVNTKKKIPAMSFPLSLKKYIKFAGVYDAISTYIAFKLFIAVFEKLGGSLNAATLVPLEYLPKGVKSACCMFF